MFVLCENGTEIDVADLPTQIRTRSKGTGGVQYRQRIPTYDEAVGRLVADALQISEGNKSRAAALLGIDRNRLYRMISRYGLAEA